MKSNRTENILWCMIVFLLSAPGIQAQELSRSQILHLWKDHHTVQIFHRNDSIKVRFNNDTDDWLYLDTIFESGVFSKGTYIAFQDIKAIYIERKSFFYQSIFRPMGSSLMLFGTYIGLNTIGLIINRGFHHPDTQFAGKYTLIAFSSGLGLHLWADKMSFKKRRLDKCRISVY